MGASQCTITQLYEEIAEAKRNNDYAEHELEDGVGVPLRFTRLSAGSHKWNVGDKGKLVSWKWKTRRVLSGGPDLKAYVKKDGDQTKYETTLHLAADLYHVRELTRTDKLAIIKYGKNKLLRTGKESAFTIVHKDCGMYLKYITDLKKAVAEAERRRQINSTRA